MISCAIIEHRGKWRLPAIGIGLLIALAPAGVLVFAAEGSSATQFSNLLRSGFSTALLRSLAVAFSVASLAVVFGLPTGLVAGLYDFPLRRLLLAALVLPLLVPSFLGAIGLSMLRTALGLPSDSFLSGLTGTVLAFTMFALPLVVFITLVSVRGITRSQTDAARLAGGGWHLVLCAGRNVLPVAVLTGLLASVFTLSDPGPGQILGYNAAASEILVSFASQYDFALASRQCLLLAAVVLVFALPVIVLLAPRLATGLLARDVIAAPLMHNPTMTIAGPLLLAALFLVTSVLPLLGIAQPLLGSFPIERTMQEIGRTVGSTMFYGVTASVIATAAGVTLALIAGRTFANRAILTGGLLLLIALPPALSALGFIQLASLCPSQLDALLRGQLTVSASLALRLVPITTIFALRSFGASSPTWADAAAVHGVPFLTYLRKILLPWMSGAIFPAAVLVALLALSDVTTALLLHPPGKASLPLAIFTVMANAPESLVGALCVTYVASAALALGLGTIVVGRRRRVL